MFSTEELKTTMVTFLLTIIFFLASCNDNTLGDRQKTRDRHLENPEHHINDSLDILKHDSSVLSTGWYYVVDTANGYKRKLDKSEETYYLDPTPIITAKNVTIFEIYESSYNGKKYYGLSMHLDKDGTERWSYATGKAQVMYLRLAFILDNRLLQVAKVNAQITGGVTALNRGNYSRQELENFKTIIESER
jgi:preprotein translocase subunit SecD